MRLQWWRRPVDRRLGRVERIAHAHTVKRLLRHAVYLLRHPARLGASILAMYVLAPFVALVIALLADVPVSVKVALVTLALSPVSPLLPRREAGAPYAAALYACSALLAALTVPIGVELLGLSRLDPLQFGSPSAKSLAAATGDPRERSRNSLPDLTAALADIDAAECPTEEADVIDERLGEMS